MSLILRRLLSNAINCKKMIKIRTMMLKVKTTVTLVTILMLQLLLSSAGFAGGQDTTGRQHVTSKSKFAEVAFAQVAFVKGVAEYSPMDSQHEKRELVKNDKLYASDVVKTGPMGFLSLTLSSGAIVNLQPSSHVRLEERQCQAAEEICLVVVDIESGKVRTTDTRSRAQATRFVKSTPFESAAVRGPRFYFDPDLLIPDKLPAKQ